MLTVFPPFIFSSSARFCLILFLFFNFLHRNHKKDTLNAYRPLHSFAFLSAFHIRFAVHIRPSLSSPFGLPVPHHSQPDRWRPTVELFNLLCLNKHTAVVTLQDLYTDPHRLAADRWDQPRMISIERGHYVVEGQGVGSYSGVRRGAPCDSFQVSCRGLALRIAECDPRRSRRVPRKYTLRFIGC